MRPAQVLRDLGPHYAANGLIGLIFSCTGPVAVILAAGAAGGLSQSQLASWIFGVFVLNGILTIAMSLTYRQPLGFFWTIPGTILVGGSLTHLSWAEVVGAFFVTAALITALGVTGLVRRVMEALPMPIVMAMVAGVFLSFGINLVTALGADVAIAVPMIAIFLLLSSVAALGKWMPPILGALVAGGVAVAVSGRFSPQSGDTAVFAAPVFTAPVFTWSAIVELVIPLAITVLVVQNGQGIAVLRSAGHNPPINVTAIVCGLWSFPAACVGAVSSCLTGPTNALLVASGERARQYTAALTCGVLAIVFGLFAPLFVRWMIAAPASFVAVLGGLAMLKALQGAFVAGFGRKYTMGALIAFVVTASDVTFWGIGAAFWGIVAGVVVSWLLERQDWKPASALRTSS
ncbi:benzoate/H(+) symporter BenE family transporter [Rhodococcus chondri]|uniref:Benzoate/H(+) symporter BenE family transporter n=1 Tax=Rhodococcus chondri TaxID=3065941 RepID=A0ABU7K1V0_9NOCA|nr:benzoate/H(+) symporter BenE family transporter [Rhodococcus sp. CC-R104]MEE2035517.1 benzoate/H(+) symporter BenE family transporter [Rhodococcus sp. CC-R104]